jgi:hypothetical protein
MRADVTWKYDPSLSTATEFWYYAEGTVTFAYYAPDPCYQIAPLSYTLTATDPPGRETFRWLKLDYTTDPPGYLGAGLTVWEATYTNVCSGGSARAGIGGPWFGGEGRTSPDRRTVSGPSGSPGTITYDYTFTQQ